METNPSVLLKVAARFWYNLTNSGGRITGGAAQTIDPMKKQTLSPPLPPSSPAITLLDLYEIEWITKQLEKFIVSSALGECDGSGDRWSAKGRKTGKKGFGFVKHAASICGSVSEVAVEATRRPNPAKPLSKTIQR